MISFPELPKGLKVTLFAIGVVVALGVLGIAGYESVVLKEEPTTKAMIFYGIFLVFAGMAMMPHRVLAVLEKLPGLRKK